MDYLFAKIQLPQVQLLAFSSWVLLFQSVSAQKHKQEKSTENNKNPIEKNKQRTIKIQFKTST